MFQAPLIPPPVSEPLLSTALMLTCMCTGLSSPDRLEEKTFDCSSESRDWQHHWNTSSCELMKVKRIESMRIRWLYVDSRLEFVVVQRIARDRYYVLSERAWIFLSVIPITITFPVRLFPGLPIILSLIFLQPTQTDHTSSSQRAGLTGVDFLKKIYSAKNQKIRFFSPNPPPPFLHLFSEHLFKRLCV
jgi:hypothetical protein